MINIQKNIPLAKYTTFRIGGPARFFVEVENEEELMEALKYAQDNKLEFFVLGGGSNLLVSDKGYEGLVIKTRDTRYKIQDTKIEAGAGISMAKLVKESIENSLAGLEWAAGLPGSLGGAIRGNAGTFGLSMKDIIESVKILEITNNQDTITKKITNSIPNTRDQIPNKFQIINYKLQDCQFSYRDSIFKRNPNLIILSAVLKLQSGKMETLKHKFKECIKWRKETFPESLSPGSFFKHTEPTERNLREIKKIPRFAELKLHEKNTIPSGFVIEMAELMGKKIGGAMVSEKHANFIINTGNATAEDVIMLASLIKQQVRDKFGVELKEEVQYLGFS